MMIVRAVVIAGVFAAAVPARAQSVEAEVLFQEGKKLLKEGKIAEACDKLEASDRLESSTGTLLNLADCREKNKQLATAWADFRKAAVTAKSGGDAKREAEARRRAAALEPRLSYLTISVPDTSRIDGLAIARNGTAIDPALWNQGVPVDIGSYEISGQAPGHERWSTHVQVTAEGQKASVEVPRFKALGELAPQPKADTTAAKPPTKPANDEGDDQADKPTHPSMFTGMRKAAIGVAAAGVVGVVVGLVFGSKANDLEKQADAICPTTTCNDMHALQLNADAKSNAQRATIAYIGGGVAIAGGVVLWFLGAPKAGGEGIAIAPMIGRASGLVVTGRF